jgi:hypothetical protein
MLDLTLARPTWLLGRLLLARYCLHGHSELSSDVQRIATLAQIAHLFHRTKDSEHFSAYRNLRPPSQLAHEAIDSDQIIVGARGRRRVKSHRYAPAIFRTKL